MVYQHIDPVKIDKKRMSRDQFVIHGCMKQHLFDYNPGSSKVHCMEYLCDCTECLKFDFENCVKTTNFTPVPIDHEKECQLDVDGEDEHLKMFEFVGIDSFVALVSEDSNEPVYILKVEGKERAEQEQKDDFGHIIPPGQLYLSGKYLKKERSRSGILPGKAICTPDEMFEVFVDVLENLTIEKETFSALITRASA